MKVFKRLQTKIFEKCLLTLSINKCELFSTHTWDRSVDTFGLKPRAQVKYLGITLRRTPSLTRTNWQQQMMKKAKHISWKLQPFQMETKNELMRIFLRSAMMYGAVPLYQAGIIDKSQLRLIRNRTLK